MGILNSIEQTTKRAINSKHMLKGITLASFLESIIVPIPLEAILVPLLQARREKIWLIALMTTLGCMVGALVGYALGYYLFDLIGDWVIQTFSSPEQFEQVKSMVGDVSAELHAIRETGGKILFEGAQGALLDLDHGTYPYVTSCNTVAGAVTTGAGYGSRFIDEVMGVVKAYTTRVGSGPFPTELQDDIGQTLGERGVEFGTVTGRPRRCGWFDAVLMQRAVQASSISTLCLTKLDVLDTLETINICTAYRLDGQTLTMPPIDADDLARCEPIYETLPGWQCKTQGITVIDDLPEAAVAYIQRLTALLAVPISIISTGPDRAETIVLSHPFAAD